VFVAFLGMVDPERDNHKNETDQRSGRAPGKRVETIPVILSPLPLRLLSQQL
jgi:hypothetical protein